MDLIDLEDESIDAEVLDSLAVTQEDFRVRIFPAKLVIICRKSGLNSISIQQITRINVHD